MVGTGNRTTIHQGTRAQRTPRLAVMRGTVTAIVLGIAVNLISASPLEAQQGSTSELAASHSSVRDRDSNGAGERADILARVLRTDSNASLRRNAAWGLARFANSSVGSQALAAALEHDASADVRETSAWSLSQSGATAPDAVSALDRALRSDGSPSVRATSAWALGQLRVSGSNDALEAALRDPDPGVRQRAIWAVGHVRYRTAPAELVSGLRDPDPHVRSLAAWALMSIGDHATIPALKSAFLAEADPHLRIDDMHALASMGDASLDAIRSILESPDRTIQARGVEALSNGRASGPWPWPWPDPRPFP